MKRPDSGRNLVLISENTMKFMKAMFTTSLDNEKRKRVTSKFFILGWWLIGPQKWMSI